MRFANSRAFVGVLIAVSILFAGAMNRYEIRDTEAGNVTGLVRVDRLTGKSEICFVVWDSMEYPVDGGKRPSWCPVFKSQ